MPAKESLLFMRKDVHWKYEDEPTDFFDKG